MKEKTVYALDEKTGLVGPVPEHYIDSPLFGGRYKLRRNGKPINSEVSKPRVEKAKPSAAPDKKEDK